MRKPIHLDVDRNAPLPLAYRQALTRALELRALGPHWSYTVIADCMATYHGFDRGAWWWSAQLRAAGALPRPRGSAAFTARERDAA